MIARIFLPSILLTAFGVFSSCKQRDGSELADATSGQPAPSAPSSANWCYPETKFRDVPVGTPFIAVICENDSCGGNRSILKLDATCNPSVKLGPDSRPQLNQTASDYVYDTVGQIASGYSNGLKISCTEAVQKLDAAYDIAGISGDCRILMNTRLEGQHTYSIVKEGPIASEKRAPLPAAMTGSKIGRDLSQLRSGGKSVTDLLDDMAEVIEGYSDEFRVHSSETGGCLRNSRIAGNTDIQAYAYCRIPHEARRCFGGLINEYKMHCPRQKLANDPRPWVKTYAPDLENAFRTCFLGTDQNAFRNGKGEFFPYFREPGKEWRAELFLAVFDSIEGLRDWSVDSQIEVIRNSKKGYNTRRIVDTYPNWQEDQPRYVNVAKIQTANILKEKALLRQMRQAGVGSFTLDMVAPPCDGSKFVPMLGGEMASHNQVTNPGVTQPPPSTIIPLSALGQPLDDTTALKKGEKGKFYVLMKILDQGLTADPAGMNGNLKAAVSQVLRAGGQLGGVHKTTYNMIDAETFRVAVHLRNDSTVADIKKLSDQALSIEGVYQFP